jgi:hypothetical protein
MSVGDRRPGKGRDIHPKVELHGSLCAFRCAASFCGDSQIFRCCWWRRAQLCDAIAGFRAFLDGALFLRRSIRPFGEIYPAFP